MAATTNSVSSLPKPRKPRKAKAKGWRRFLSITMRIAMWMFLTSILTVLVFRFINPPLTPLMLIRMVEGTFSGESVGINKSWKSLNEINPSIMRAVIAAEDARFFEHGGVDWDAVERAKEHNEESDGEHLQGASTITMQCARNVFLWQGRNYIRKGLEVYFTYLMEFLWGKKRILEVYLNVIEWGDGVYGIDAAANKYFNVSASNLSQRQASLLASILPNPRVFSPVNPTARIARKASTITARAAAVDLKPLQ